MCRPNSSAFRTSAQALAAQRMMPFEGTQPTFKQSPPIKCFSIKATLAPRLAATTAVINPAVPAPDDHNIVATSRFGIDPVRGMHVADERAVMLIVRQYETVLHADSSQRSSLMAMCNHRSHSSSTLHVSRSRRFAIMLISQTTSCTDSARAPEPPVTQMPQSLREKQCLSTN